MSTDDDLNERGNHQGRFSQGVGGWAEYTVQMTDIADTVRHDVAVPPGKVIPVIFLPGVMGSNLRMSKRRQAELKLKDNRAWRPDDLSGTTGIAGVMGGMGRGGFLKNALPAQRQINFDPDETEVDYYHFTENAERFDPDGSETRASDKRHANVPDDLSPIPPLIGTATYHASRIARERATKRKTSTPAQVARWRGWSEVMFSGAYGEVLKTTEALLNNMIDGAKLHHYWQEKPVDARGRSRYAVPYRKVTELLLRGPTAFGAPEGLPVTESDLRRIGACWYPVHAMGYNFLKSNGESAIAIAERIRRLVKGYQSRHFSCDEVIIVTHSMGGLLGRALLHPEYGNLQNDKTLKVLGMYHSVMPTRGAAATYKRIRFGFQESYVFFAETVASLFGVDGKHATAVLANTQGPLELLPGQMYGSGWLKLKDCFGKVIWSWPAEQQSALDSIYLQPQGAWWRLIRPDWVNPANVSEKKGGIDRVYRRLRAAFDFIESISNTFHPSRTYASYCSSAGRPSYGEVVFRIMDGGVSDAIVATLPPVSRWQLQDDDAKGTLTVLAGARKLTLRLDPAAAAGDDTVPSERSAQRTPGVRFVHGGGGDGDYDHQNSYADPQVLASLLYSIVQMAKTAKWESK